MQPWLQLRAADLAAERPAGSHDDVHFTEALVAAVLDQHSAPGDVVLDPFAGYGTTLVVAGRMGREAVGVELLPERAALARARLTGRARLVTGDARDLTTLVRGPVDLCVTSSPYMTATGHPQNPLTAYETLDGDYPRYLAELGDVFGQVAALLRPGGHLVLNVANLETGGVITPLAWDVARTVAHRLTFLHESFLCWDAPRPGITGDYCLVFRRPHQSTSVRPVS
jgi:DNA modification methylase